MRYTRLLAAAVPLVVLAACGDGPGPTQVPQSMTVPRGQIVASSTCAPCHGLDYRGDSTGTTGAPDLWLITEYAPDEVELLLGAGVTAAGDSVAAEMRESVVRALAPQDRTAVYDYLRAYLRGSVLEPTR